MGAINWLTIFLKNPLEFNFKTLIQLFLYYLKRRNSAWKEHPSSGWDRQTMRRCWELLDMTDKRWCMVAKQLDGDLLRVVSYAQFTASNFGVVIPSIYFVLGVLAFSQSFPVSLTRFPFSSFRSCIDHTMLHRPACIRHHRRRHDTSYHCKTIYSEVFLHSYHNPWVEIR